jgi:rubrerythrin
VAETPSYLGLLNGVSHGESRAHCYLSAWADVTTNDEVRAVLRTVAAREGEHGMAFAKRIDELGFALEPRDDPKFEDRMAIASSTTLTDLQKMEQLRFTDYFVDDGPDIFDKFFSDHTIDIQTGALLGRYICEERDTIGRLRCCYDLLRASSNGAGSTSAAAGGSAEIKRIEAKIDALCDTVERLSDAMRAPALTGNSRKK